MSEKGMELLAPAGNLQVFKSVINAGADAVYFGGPSFGARAYAGNLTLEESADAIDYAHLHGKKAYLTVNTLLKNREMEELYSYLRPFYEMGLDAVLVQDLGVLDLIRSSFPGLAIHMSTQASITTSLGAGWLKSLGVERIVAARELSLLELKEMYQNTGMEIEAFVHGALCVCYSGQCLMSSFLGGRSGNRGRCAQPCRLPYQIKGQKTPGPYLLSPKDFCLIDFLPQMDAAGVYSYKIEGRMKSEEYATTVVSVYREAMDRYLSDGAENYSVSKGEHELLRDAGSRHGFTDLYLRERNGKELMTFQDSSHEAKLDSLPLLKERKIPVEIEALIESGKPMSISIRCQGKRVRKQSINPVEVARKAPLNEDKVRKQLEKLGGTPYLSKKTDLCLSSDAFVPVSAINELRREAIEELTRLLIRENGPCLSKRQKAVKDWEEKKERRISSSLTEGKKSLKNPEFSLAEISKEGPEVFVSFLHADQLFPLAESLKGIQADWNLILPVEFLLNGNEGNGKKDVRKGDFSDGKHKGDWDGLEFFQKLCPTARLWLDLPEVVRERERKLLDQNVIHFTGFSGFRCHSLDGLAYLLDRGIPKEQILLSSRIYTWSDQTVLTFRSMGFSRMEMPVELTEKELAHRENETSILPIYGRQVLMIKADCTHKNLKGCDRKSEILSLTDRKGKNFPLWNRCSVCTNYIYNSLPTSLLSDFQAIKKLHPLAYEIALTLEDPHQIKEIGQAVSAFLRGEKKDLSFPVTRGHFRNGVL